MAGSLQGEVVETWGYAAGDVVPKLWLTPVAGYSVAAVSPKVESGANE